MKIYVLIITIFFIFIIVIPTFQTINGESQISMDENDIRYYDYDMNEIYETDYGNKLQIVVTHHNVGNTPTNNTTVNVSILIVDKNGESNFLATLSTSDIIIGANNDTVIKVLWDTDKHIGLSWVKATEGVYKIWVTYYPTDDTEPETAYNSGSVFSANTITLRDDSNDEGDKNCIIILLIVVVLCFILILLIIKGPKKKQIRP